MKLLLCLLVIGCVGCTEQAPDGSQQRVIIGTATGFSALRDEMQKQTAALERIAKALEHEK